MNFVFLGLSLSSSWGNGHATTYRGLLRALHARGHSVLFLECDRPWYADTRDLTDPDFCTLRFYDKPDDLAGWRQAIEDADAVVVGSFVPDGVQAAARAQDWARGAVAFYDIDTPVTLAKLAAGDEEYLSRDAIPRFDLYLSFTGGPTLRHLQDAYGARSAHALYCSVDPTLYRPVRTVKRWDLGYLGTYSPDRQPVLSALLVEAARLRPEMRFVVAGPQYPEDIVWGPNVDRIEHLPPAEHAAFYASLRWTLNVTRADMIAAGYSPSVRLFEAASCGVPIISDIWAGLDRILRPGTEIVTARGTGDVLEALDWPDDRRQAVGVAARARVLAAHTPDHRAAELERLVAGVLKRRPVAVRAA